MDSVTSRFFRLADPKTHDFVYPIPEAFWSRLYEYEWTKQFVEEDDVCLDAASGVVHPLQYYLADHCRSTYACDLDPRIGTHESIVNTMKEWKVDHILNQERYLSGINRTVCSLVDLPYENEFFDKVFCISTLEHLRDRFNKFPIIATKAQSFRNFLRADIFNALSEFKRVLKKDGKIILTFDYPRINLRYLAHVVEDLGLKFETGVDFSLPPDAVQNKDMGLYCFRAVLVKS